jgi:hypothetical protein
MKLAAITGAAIALLSVSPLLHLLVEHLRQPTALLDTW